MDQERPFNTATSLEHRPYPLNGVATPECEDNTPVQNSRLRNSTEMDASRQYPLECARLGRCNFRTDVIEFFNRTLVERRCARGGHNSDTSFLAGGTTEMHTWPSQ